MIFLGKNIRYLRKSMSRTQTELASMIGKGQTTIGNWENAISEPNLEELVLLSQYFATSIDRLLTVDLSQTGTASQAPAQKKAPGHDQLPMAGEDKLEYLIREIHKMREELDQIKKGS